MLVKIPELEEIPLDEIVDLRHCAHHIVGEKYEEAPYCQTMEMLYELLGKRVRLFMDRQSYYKRASILLLTSDFEGFPLVLAECMSFGVIPAVYNSYSAVCDIIDGGKDGIVLPYHKNGYQAEEAAGMIANIMKDDGKREQMALAAIKKSKEYSVEKIYSEWERVFNGCI